MAAPATSSNPDMSSPSSNPAAAPSATITPTHFQHRTTTAAPVNPLIDTATPAINTVPIELDSTPVTSPVVGGNESSSQIKGSLGGLKERVHGAVAGAEAKIKEALGKDGSGAAVSTPSPADDRGILAGGAANAGKLRADSAAVMAGPPGTPGPEDFEAAKVDAAVTPS